MRPKYYTEKHIEFLRANYLKMNARDLTRAFNERFNTEKTETAIKSVLNARRIRCGRKPKDRLITRLRIYTEAQARFIRENYRGRSVQEMTVLFNDRFGENKTEQQIKTFVHNRGITSGRTGCFPKGHAPWNKGTKGQGLTGANRGSFKKGDVPLNTKPLWTERVCPKDGYILMKVPERNPHTGCPTRYKAKHVWIWEQANGPVPKGMAVIFRDGDKTHCKLDNLMLVTRAELLNLNRHRYKEVPAELKPHVLALSTLQVKTWAIEKRA